MNLPDLKNELDLRRVLPMAALAVVTALLVLALTSLSDLKRKAATAERAAHALQQDAGIMAELEHRLETHLRRIRVAPKGADIPTLVEELARRLGLDDRIAGMKPGEARTNSGFSERSAEVSLENIDLNEAVNFLYRLEHHAAFFVVRHVEMRRNFQDPDRLDMSLTLSLISATDAG